MGEQPPFLNIEYVFCKKHTSFFFGVSEAGAQNSRIGDY